MFNLDEESANGVLSLLEDCSIHSDSRATLQNVDNDFLESEMFKVLRENGLLII
jgi:hypothetical protein